MNFKFTRFAVAFLGLLLLVVSVPGCQQAEEKRKPAHKSKQDKKQKRDKEVKRDRGSKPTIKSKLNSLNLSEFKAELKEREIWSGGKSTKFTDVGRGTFDLAIELGLKHEHRVMDIGAGSLRIGWWFVQYIDPSNYHAIEPVEERILGAMDILGLDNINVYHNYDFEFPDVKFDFAIARSIWTHASKSMISKMLSEFADNSQPDAKFLASVHLTKNEDQDYMGDEWVGRVEHDDGPDSVMHSLEWIQQETAKHGLSVKVLDKKIFQQIWLLIENLPSE